MGRGEGAGGWRQLLTHMRLPLCMFAALAVLAAAGILLLRATLLRNAAGERRAGASANPKQRVCYGIQQHEHMG